MLIVSDKMEYRGREEKQSKNSNKYYVYNFESYEGNRYGFYSERDKVLIKGAQYYNQLDMKTYQGQVSLKLINALLCENVLDMDALYLVE